SYTVTLVVSNGSACKDTLIRTNYIQINTVNLGFTASDTFATCPPLTVTFTNTSLAAGNFTWAFGNGNTSSLTSPTTIFTLPGVYNVKLKGTNSAGCMDSVYKTITILGPNGTLSYSPINGCAPLTVQFTSTNTNTTQLIWDMNNGVTQTTTGSSTSYTYTAPGKYVPKLLLSDGISCIVPDAVKMNWAGIRIAYDCIIFCIYRNSKTAGIGFALNFQNGFGCGG
ncbi:MAG: PKD domain-containing protein, partial [Sphingobacteriales bacterium]